MLCPHELIMIIVKDSPMLFARGIIINNHKTQINIWAHHERKCDVQYWSHTVCLHVFSNSMGPNYKEDHKVVYFYDWDS